MEKDNSYLIILSLDNESDPSYSKVAAKVLNTDRNDKLHFPEFCKAFPKNMDIQPESAELIAKQAFIIRGGYELVSSMDRALLLFSDYLIYDIIDNITKHRRNSSINKDDCRIIVDGSFGDNHSNETIGFYLDAINRVPGRTWMINYFGSPSLIKAGINNKPKNRDPLLHCEKVISQAAFR